MAHDFKKFPELTNSKLDFYYFQSPHRQITEDFSAKVIKVHDGDTITLRWSERDFDFPLRFKNIDAPELKINGKRNRKGEESQKWLEQLIMGQKVDILINPNSRVDKWGRLLGLVLFRGLDVGELSIMMNKSVAWENRAEIDGIPTLEEVLAS